MRDTLQIRMVREVVDISKKKKFPIEGMREKKKCSD